MLVWLWPFAMGLTGYTSLALVTALLAGVFFDTHTTTPFGLTAAVGLVIAYGASRLGREGVGDLDSAAWWVTPVLAAVAGFVAPALYVVSGAFALNFNLWRGSVLSMMLVNAGAFFILARPVTRLARIVGNVGERVHR
jgi:cell shape-determining protein MreD